MRNGVCHLRVLPRMEMRDIVTFFPVATILVLPSQPILTTFAEFL